MSCLRCILVGDEQDMTCPACKKSRLCHLDGKEVTSGTFPAQIHPPKSSTADWLQNFKVVNGHVVDVIPACANSRGG